MAIQIRSGAYEDYDAEKMVRGELALVISGDPDAEEGRSVKVAFDPDDDETLVLKSENDAALADKVDKVNGKGLSTEDYTTAEKMKLSGIAAGAEVNVNPDWDATSGDGKILNKPTTLAGYGITDAYTKTEVDAQQAEVGDELSDLKGAICLQEENIPGTTQTITFDSSGNVSQIKHCTTGTTTAVRTDAFTFAANSITEVRTLATGESLTIVTNTTTLETTVTYAAA